MSALLMKNFNHNVKGLLPETLKDDIVCALIKSVHDIVIDDMTGYAVLSELSLNGENKLANGLLSYIMILDKERRNSK